jgi:NADH-quinone oxidoreductase subunit E
MSLRKTQAARQGEYMAKQSIKRPNQAAGKKKATAGKKKLDIGKRKYSVEKKKMAASKKNSDRHTVHSKKTQSRKTAKKPNTRIRKSTVTRSGATLKKDRFQEKLSGYSGEKGVLIPLLQAAQETYGYIPASAIDQIHEVVGIPAAEIYGVITFYSQFRLKPLGKYLIKLCDGTACHVNGSERITSAIEDVLQLGGGDTTADGLFTMQKVACLGCCSLSPVIMINDETFGRLTPKKVQLLLKEFKSKTQNAQPA